MVQIRYPTWYVPYECEILVAIVFECVYWGLVPTRKVRPKIASPANGWPVTLPYSTELAGLRSPCGHTRRASHLVNPLFVPRTEMKIRRLFLAFGFMAAVVVLATATATAAEPQAKAAADAKFSFFRDIRPIFQEHCQGCHQPAKRGGNYVITGYKELIKGGESEAEAVVAGKPDDSNLILVIRPDADGKAEMPKEKPALAKAQIELITRWIQEGAVDDTPASSAIRFDSKNPPKYQSPPAITSLDFSPDGSLLAIAGYHEVLLFKPDGSELVGRLVGLSERIQSLRFSPDGQLLAVAGGSPGRMGEVQIWEVGERKLRLSAPVTYDTLYGASWSHDSSKVAFGCVDNTVRAIDAKTGEQVLYQGAHNDWVLDTVFSTDSSHLVSVSRDRSMKLIEVATQRFVDNITSITPGR